MVLSIFLVDSIKLSPVLGLDRHCPDHRDKNRKPQRQEELEQETTPTYNPAAPYHLVLIPLSMILLLFACSLK